MPDTTPETTNDDSFSPIVGAAGRGRFDDDAADEEPAAVATQTREKKSSEEKLGALRASAPKIPPRPADVDAGGLTESFQMARQQLDDVLGQQNQNLMELKVTALQGLEEAMARLETEGKRTRALLDRNETLAREADRLMAQGQVLEDQQEELEGKVNKAAERNQALADRATALREERQRLQEERDELEAAVQKETDELAMARGDVERLQQRKEQLEGENAELERIRNKLEENIARLERLRDEFMGAVNRLKSTKDELIGVAQHVDKGSSSSSS